MIITYYFHCCSDTLQKHPIRNLNDYAQTTTQPSPLTTSHSLRPSRLRMPSCRKPLQPTLPTRPPAYNPRFISSKTQDFQTPQIFASKNVSHSRFTSSIILPAAYSLCSASKLPLNWCSWARSLPILLNRHESKMTFIRAVNAKRDKAVNR